MRQGKPDNLNVHTGRLDKESTNYDDVLDAFILAPRHLRIRIKNKNKKWEPIILIHEN